MDIEGIRPARPRVRPGASKTNTPLANRTSFQATRQPASMPQPVQQFPLPRYYAPERSTKVTRKRWTRKRVVLHSSAVCMILVLGVGGFLGWKAYSNLHKVFRGKTTVAALASKPVAPELLKGEGDGRVNILLMGVGGPGHDGPDLTDTLVVMSVDPVNNTATMLSVPRDLWVKQPVNYFGSYQKINAAYESGKYRYLNKIDASQANANAVEAGFASIDQVMKTVLDININYHMLVNFQAFRQAIDTVNGVDVNVPEALVDPTMAWENKYNPVLATAGEQHMDGVKALMYARSRETTSDFARSQRQRQILLALKDKVLTAGTLSNPTKIDGLMNAFGNNVYSDLSTQGATRLYSITKKISDTNVKSIGFTDEGHKLVTTDRVGDASIVRPIAGMFDYSAIQAYVHGQLPDGYLLKEKAPLTVIAPTQTSATTTATTLKNYGYNVTGTTTTTTTGIPTGVTVVDLSNDKAPFTKHYLETRYGVNVTTALPAGVSVPTGSAKFVIINSK